MTSDKDKKMGLPGDWGKTMPFWCLACGRGFVSIERIHAHMAKEGHGNESNSVGVRGLTKRQQSLGFRLRNK